MIDARIKIIGNEDKIANEKLQSFVINEYKTLNETAENIRK